MAWTLECLPEPECIYCTLQEQEIIFYYAVIEISGSSVPSLTILLVLLEMVAQRVKKPSSIHEDVGLIPGLTYWVKDLALLLSCCIGCTCGSDVALL